MAGSLTVEAALGSRSPFDARIHEVRGQRGQIDAALAYRHLLGARSEVSDSHRNCEKCRILTLRCQPQVMGACLTQIRQAAEVLEVKPTPSPITRWCSPNRVTCCPAATSTPNR